MSVQRVLAHRPSAAMVVASAALVVAFGGTAGAAAMINGRTIKPDTVTGVQVKESSLATVPRASSLATLPSGRSETGMFGTGTGNTTGGYIGDSITYPRRLARAIRSRHIIDVQGAPSAPHCPGIGRADRGYLCLYDNDPTNVDLPLRYSRSPWVWSGGPSYGVVLFWPITGTGDAYVGGTWTVTAP
jgi:hypothetical protein